MRKVATAQARGFADTFELVCDENTGAVKTMSLHIPEDFDADVCVSSFIDRMSGTRDGLITLVQGRNYAYEARKFLGKTYTVTITYVEGFCKGPTCLKFLQSQKSSLLDLPGLALIAATDYNFLPQGFTSSFGDSSSMHKYHDSSGHYYVPGVQIRYNRKSMFEAHHFNGGFHATYLLIFKEE